MISCFFEPTYSVSPNQAHAARVCSLALHAVLNIMASAELLQDGVDPEKVARRSGMLLLDALTKLYAKNGHGSGAYNEVVKLAEALGLSFDMQLIEASERGTAMEVLQ